MIIPYKFLEHFISIIKETDTLIVTNGCFDILTVAHCRFLKEAKFLGGKLLVGITGDKGVTKLKGPKRPVNKENDRAEIIDYLEFVDYVCIFPEKTALNFLSKAEPHIYVKGGNYSVDSINQDEKRLLERIGAEIKILNLMKGYSTTETLRRLHD